MKLRWFVGLGLAFGLGLLGRPMIDWTVHQSMGGPDVKCVAAGKLCVGAAASAAVALDDDLGGVFAISCGFEQPGAGAGKHLNPLDLTRQDCLAPKYVLSFSNGRRLTNAWVEADRIVRLDDYPRHAIDF